MNALQAVCGENALKYLGLPYCFATKPEQEDTPFVQIEETVGLLRYLHVNHGSPSLEEAEIATGHHRAKRGLGGRYSPKH